MIWGVYEEERKDNPVYTTSDRYVNLDVKHSTS